MSTSDVSITVALFLLLTVTVALVLVWDGDAERARRKAKKDQRTAETMRDLLHAQVDNLFDSELDVADADHDLRVCDIEDRRFEWHGVIDDMSIAVVTSTAIA